MDNISYHSGSEVVLVLAPTLNDSSMAVEVLRGAGIEAHGCSGIEELCARLRGDCGAVVISEEAMGPTDIQLLQKTLDKQKTWSDIPIILLTRSDNDHAYEMFFESGNISLLERPFSRITLIRSVHVALRARRKQYEVRELLAALNSAKTDAERASISKTQFLANMSHEIRTPIGAILGFTDLMKNPANAAEENYKYMRIVERNSQQLLRLIDDILDLSKVEAGKMSFESVHFSLAEMLSDFISVMAFKAGEKGIGFHFDVLTPFPDIICLDPVRLRQILTNIVSNALKFTDRGEVQLTIQFANDVLRFRVIDTGVGISTEQTQRLFQPFAQADTSTTRKFGGTGLGLVLSRRLAETLGGVIELEESKIGSGSTFLIEVRAPLLPMAKLVDKEALKFFKTPSAPVKSSQALRGLKVLLVEDSLDNQILISTYLRKEGAIVKVASDGAQGVKTALAETFDILLMDIQMPVLDGYQAVRMLRKENYTTPILALTAHAMKEERIRCLETGFTDFLTKPIQRETLIKAVTKHLRLKPVPSKPFPPENVLR